MIKGIQILDSLNSWYKKNTFWYQKLFFKSENLIYIFLISKNDFLISVNTLKILKTALHKKQHFYWKNNDYHYLNCLLPSSVFLYYFRIQIHYANFNQIWQQFLKTYNSENTTHFKKEFARTGRVSTKLHKN